MKPGLSTWQRLVVELQAGPGLEIFYFCLDPEGTEILALGF